MSEHSPGPWHCQQVRKAEITPTGIVYQEGDQGVVADARGYVIAEHANPGDAALIASAPTLKADLAECLALLREMEWAGSEAIAVCPVCERRPAPRSGRSKSAAELSVERYVTIDPANFGHAPGCRLAALLAKHGGGE